MRVDGPFSGAGFFKHRFEIIMILGFLLHINPAYVWSGFVMLLRVVKTSGRTCSIKSQLKIILFFLLTAKAHGVSR